MRKLKTVGMAAAMLILAAGVAYASGGEHSDSGKWLNFLYRVINFAIVAGIIYKLLGKRLAEFFSGRRYQIESELNDLDERRSQAEQKLKEVEDNIADLDSEKEKILAQAREQGEALKAAIVKDAEQTAERIKAQAEAGASQEAKLAVENIRAEIAEQVVAEAEKMIKKQLKKKDHEGLINDYLKRVVLN